MSADWQSGEGEQWQEGNEGTGKRGAAGRKEHRRQRDRQTLKKATGSEKEGRSDTAKGSAHFA